MNNTIRLIKREFIGVLPPSIFFFVVFQLLAFTRALILKEYGIQVSNFLNATFAALLVGKIVLIADKLPLVNRFPDKPLIYNIMWKTLIYMVAAVIVRYVEHLIPLISEYKNLKVASNHLNTEIVWPHFWLVQIWLFICFFLYSTIRELVRFLGRNKVLIMFFGSSKSSS